MTGKEPQTDEGKRRCEILNAAFAELCARGYAGMTMLAVAKRARASKETVYALFGSKERLLEALVAGRSERMRAALIPAVDADGVGADLGAGPNGGTGTDPARILGAFAVDFLTLITDPGTVAVHRLAIAEAERSPELGRVLDRYGRAPVRASLLAYLEHARATHQLSFDSTEDAAATLMGLLLGDLLIPLLQNLRPPPTADQIQARAERSMREFLRVYREPAPIAAATPPHPGNGETPAS